MAFGARARASEAVELAGGDMALTLAPALGGSALSLTFRGENVLRPTPARARDPMATASFPLAPFANRIGRGRFPFDGRMVSLKRNYPGEKHPLHGDAWLMPWRLDESDAYSARLSLDARKRRGGKWPWAFSCTQTISLDGEGAHFALTLRNESDKPMPASIGFHPAFARPRGAALKAHVTGVWRTDASLLPTHFDPLTDLQALGEGLDEAPFVDHCHAGWDGEATLTTPKLKIRLSATPELGFLHIFAPRDADFVCVEPVSAMPDAFNRASGANTGLSIIAPGETLTGGMRISAAPAEA